MKTVLSLIVVFLSLAGPFPGSARFAAQTKTIEKADTSSTLTYRLTHPLHEVEAVSREVRYRVEIDPVKHEIGSVSASVDVMSFSSGNSNRDSHAMEVIDALTFPEAGNGDSISVAGKVTFHGVTKNATMKGVVRWMPDRLNVSGGFSLSLTEFQIERPSLLMIPVNDTLRFSLDATFPLN
jgi:polyisoprenoid-binding protein YceI